MIVSCPSCATSYDLPEHSLTVDGTMIRCASCGRSWLESRAVEVIDATAEPVPNLPAMVPDEDGYELEIEALRLARASFAAEREHKIQQEHKQATLRGWGILGGCVAAGLAILGLFPQQIAKHAPGTLALYERVGIDINFRGFEIRNIKQQHMVSDGTLVYAVRGEVTNVAGKDSKAPALRFILRDAGKREIYAWTLAGVTNRMLKPDETTSFVTRIASPPESADELQIRFARAAEIGSNARP